MNTVDVSPPDDHGEENKDAEEGFREGKSPKLTEKAGIVEIINDVTIWFLIDNLSTDDHPLEYDNTNTILTLVREQHGTAKQ